MDLLARLQLPSKNALPKRRALLGNRQYPHSNSLTPPAAHRHRRGEVRKIGLAERTHHASDVRIAKYRHRIHSGDEHKPIRRVMQIATSPFLYWLVTLVVAGVGAYFGAYLREKGKNRATVEDIDRLTRVVESIKTENAARLAEISHQNAVLIEQLKSQNQLRLAAVDRRLQAHQEAFVHWRRLVAVAHSEEVGKVVMECQTWWEQNALYLEPQVRDAFNRAYHAAAAHRSLVHIQYHDVASLANANENWQLVMAPGDIIMEAVALPALNDLERSTQTPSA